MQIETLVPWLQLLVLLAVVGGAFYVMHLRMRHRAHYGIGHFGDDQRVKTNCPDCGARVPADDSECAHCGEPLGDETDSPSVDGAAATDPWDREDEQQTEREFGDT